MTDTKSLREAATMALEALEYHTGQTRPIERTALAIEALRASLALPDEPVAWKPEGYNGSVSFTSPDGTGKLTIYFSSAEFADKAQAALAGEAAALQTPATVERKPLTNNEIHLAMDAAVIEANGMPFSKELQIARVIEALHNIRDAA